MQYGGMELAKPEKHVFWGSIRKSSARLDDMKAKLSLITPDRIAEYRKALPDVWLNGNNVVEGISSYLQTLVQYADESLKEVEKALS